jgi:PhnB protein
MKKERTMSTSVSETTTMELQPYIFFYGRSQEALDFYKSVLGGSYEATPQEGSVKIMHATFTAPGLSFMCSDGRPEQDGKRIDPDEGNVSLSLGVPDKAQGDRIFAALSHGGKVLMPLADAPWGDGRFGVIHDRFGLEWMVTTP